MIELINFALLKYTPFTPIKAQIMTNEAKKQVCMVIQLMPQSQIAWQPMAPRGKYIKTKPNKEANITARSQLK